MVILVIKVSAVLILLLNALSLMAQSMPPEKGNWQAKNVQGKVRQIYTSQIGVREKPANSGPQVEKYLKYVGLSNGNPWCAAFVCWVFGEVGVDNPRSGWSPDLFPGSRIIYESGKLKAESGKLLQKSPYGKSGWAESRCACPSGAGGGFCKMHSVTNKPVSPAAGDVFGLYFPEKGRIAHVGFVDEWQDPWVISVEGNTNVQGSREGDGVYRKRRLVKTIHKVARYIE